MEFQPKTIAGREIMSTVLVTGGCGFVGSWTVDLLIEKGYTVKIFDSLESQVHRKGIPEYVNKKAELSKGDIRDKKMLGALVSQADAIVHLAAEVGVGQSMYQIERYVDSNTRGTATLLDMLVDMKHKIKKLVVASSMSIYGEGKYYCKTCRSNNYPDTREQEQLNNRVWEPLCPVCRNHLEPVATDEMKPLLPTSIYAMTKRHQEEMSILIGKTYGIPTVALRYFNIYGPRQSLSNPYTGVCAIFLSRILNGEPPYIFEDGRQSRDFVHVRDIAKANVLALESDSATFNAINIGSGQSVSIGRLANVLLNILDVKLEPLVSGEYRKGDIRHCYADIAKAKQLLKYTPSTDLTKGLEELADWAQKNRKESLDLFEAALNELKTRKLA